MAREVGTSRQNIENLESKGYGQPRYIAELARVMGTSVDDLLGKTPDDGLVLRAEILSTSEWGHLKQYRELIPSDKQEIDQATHARLEKMREARREHMKLLGLPPEAPPSTGNKLPLAPRSATPDEHRVLIRTARTRKGDR